MRYRLGDITIKHWNDWDRVPRVDAFILFGGNILAAPTAFQVFAAQAISYLAVTAVTSWALRALAPKPDFGSSRGLLVNAREATAPQEIVYGEIRKGGTVTFIESTGDTNQYLHQVIVLAGHEVNSIGHIHDNQTDYDIYINENRYKVNGSGWVTDQRYDEETEAYVTDNKWGYNSGTSTSKIRIKKHTGADNQTADSDLVSETSVTSDFKGEGIAYLYVRMEYDQDVFAEGVPLFTAKVQGKKVYDPRTSTTGYSANAALCIRDYLASAYGLDNSGDTNDAYFQAAANTCDESVTLSGSGTESRYEINGIISLDRSPSDILGDMMTACAGTLFWGQGEWHLKVGEYTSSIKTFTLDDLRGPITLDTKHSRRDNFNIVRGTFNDAEQGFIRADYPEIRSSAFITNDGGVENALDLALPLTTSAATAQRLAKMTLFRAREEMTFTADFGLEAFEVECGDIISLDIERYGWDNPIKEFEVVGWKFKNDGDAGDLRVALTLRETSSAAFSWSAEESAITANNSTLPSPSDSITPSSITVTDTGVVQTDGTFVAQVKVAWTAGTNKFIDYHEVQWKLTGTSDYASSQIDAGENSIILGPFEAGQQYNIRVRAVMTTGRSSPFVAASPHTVGGDTIAPSPVTGLSVTGGIQSVTLDWTAPTTQAGGGDLYDLKGYYVYRNTSNSQPSNPVAFVSADRFVDGGLADNTTYYYWVEAIDFTTPPNTSTTVASDPVATNPALVDGADGASVLVVYADDAAGTNQSLSAGSRTFVQYYEYTGTAPSLPVTGTFVQFVGDDGTNGASIFPIYADDASGTNQSFSSTGKEYVTFYEATSQPTLPVTGQTFVKFVGDDGIGQDGDDGDTVATGRVYYNTLQQSTPSVTPSATGYDFSTGELTGLTSSYSQTQPAVDITSTTDYEWSASFTATKNGSTGTVTVDFGTLSSAIQVTTNIESDNFQSGVSGFRFERDTGDIEVNNGTFRGDITVQGEIINTTDAHLRAEVGGPFHAITSSATINSLLDGAGAYVFVMVGGGGGGTASDTDEYETGCGGAGAGCAIFSFEWNGSTSLVFSRGNGGIGSFNAGDGTSSTFSYGGSTLAIARGGDGAIHYQTSSGTANGGTATVYTNVVTLLGYYTRTGGSTSVTGGQKSSGGGVDFFGTGDADGAGSTFGGNCGGNPWGVSRGSPVFSNDEVRTIMGLPAGISYSYNGTTGHSEAWGIQGGHAGAGAGEGYASYAGNGGVFCGGGDVRSQGQGYGGNGGYGGGGGGSRSDQARSGGDGGNGVLYWSKL